MPSPFDWLMVIAALAVTFYAQHRIPYHTATRRQAAIARLLLFVVGIGVGWSAIVWYRDTTPLIQITAFFTGFGLVHVPAAFILWSKRLRGVHR